MPLVPRTTATDTLGDLAEQWGPTALRWLGATPVTAPLAELAAQRTEDPEGSVDWGSLVLAAGLAAIPIATLSKASAKQAKVFAGRIKKAAEHYPQLQLGRFPTTTIRRMITKLKEKNGYSVKLATGEVLTEGLAVGRYRNADPRTLVLEPAGAQGYRDPRTGATMSLTEGIRRHWATNAKELEPVDRIFGLWRDKKTGTVYLDVAQWYPEAEKRRALKHGADVEQLAGWRFTGPGTGEEFPIVPWATFVKSPEFKERLHTMAKVGREYLDRLGKDHNGEWWDINGSTFERVYGKENMEVVAGLIAATAPSRDPRGNLQVMSEYMRRFLAGEPLAQPGWRKPASVMTGRPGARLGLEKADTERVLKAVEGRWREFGKEPGTATKTIQEAGALMGLPDYFPADRWWGRLSENPMGGTVLHTTEPPIFTPEEYWTMRPTVEEAATEAGRTLRDFTADVWTGTRETVKNTGELFGAPYRVNPSALGESHGYVGHFEDLLAEKAAHLSRFEGRPVSVDELVSRLRAGRATLLGLAPLAVPVLGAATLGAQGWDQDQDIPPLAIGPARP